MVVHNIFINNCFGFRPFSGSVYSVIRQNLLNITLFLKIPSKSHLIGHILIVRGVDKSQIASLIDKISSKSEFIKVLDSGRNLRVKNFIQRTKTSRYDWGLLVTVSVICILGIAFLASSLSIKSQQAYQQELAKQIGLGLGLGGIAAFIISRTDYHFFLKHAKLGLILNYILLGFLAIFAVYTNILTFGQNAVQAAINKSAIIAQFSFLPIKPYIANGAIRWIDFPFLPNFQPSEFAKLALLMYFSSFFWKFENKEMKLLNLKKPIYAFLISACLIIVQPDLGTVLIISAILAAAMWSAKIPVKILVYLGTIVVILGVVLTFATDYRKSRVTAFLDPTSSNATQIRGVQRAITNGGFFGKGYGNSELKQQPGILYEQTTDAIIAIIGEEMGFVGTLLFLSLYLVILLRGLEIARNAPDLGGQALATGISVWITGQAFINITGITGLTPLKGVPLPFVSEGGSSLLINLIAIGFLLNISSQSINHNSSKNLNSLKPKNYFSKKIISAK